jgi:hypothetical protein
VKWRSSHEAHSCLTVKQASGPTADTLAGLVTTHIACDLATALPPISPSADDERPDKEDEQGNAGHGNQYPASSTHDQNLPTCGLSQ